MNSFRLRFLAAAVPLTLSLLVPASAHAETVVTAWDAVALQAIRDTHPGPPMVARALAIVHTSMYDAWAAYDKKASGTQLGDHLRRPKNERTDANKKKAISYAAYRALVDLYPSEKDKFDAKLTALGYDPANNSTDTSTPEGIGNVAAKAVIDFRHKDGSNQLGDLHPGAYSDYTGYAPVNTPDQINDPGRWQPLRTSDGHGGTVVQKYIAPHWGNVKGFAIKSWNQFRLGPPVAVDTAEYRTQAQQVVEYQQHLDDREKVIAEYWADGPSSELPPGHWALFAKFVSDRDNHTMDQDVKMLFAMTNAVLDASIVSWGTKRQYDYVRPVTAINYLYRDQIIPTWDGGTELGQDWRPYQAVTVVTPPFPEYPSGHSIFSGAAAEVLRTFTGSDSFGFSTTIPAGSSFVQPGQVPAKDIPFYWATFSEAADEAGISRRYGGIHFVQGDMDSRAAGKQIGALAWKKALNLFGDNGDGHGHNSDSAND